MIQLQSLPVPQPPPKIPFPPPQHDNKSKMIIIQLHPLSVAHPHPVLQFVAAKSLIFEPPKNLYNCIVCNTACQLS